VNPDVHVHTSVDDVAALEAARIAAAVACDAETLARLIDPQCTYVHSTGDVDTGSGYVDKLRRGVFSYDYIDVDQRSIRPLPFVTIVVFRMHASLRVDGVSAQTSSRCTTVWVATDSTHRLNAFHATPIHVPRPCPPARPSDPSPMPRSHQ
jgi:hypothetical protein